MKFNGLYFLIRARGHDNDVHRNEGQDREGLLWREERGRNQK